MLDVRLRTRGPRWAGWRVAARTVGLSLTSLGAVVLVICGVLWVYRTVFIRNPVFAIGRIEIRTDGVLPKELLLRWSGVGVGTNLLSLDLEGVRRRLELMPWIRSASLRRFPPDTLRIVVSERRALAVVQLPYLGAEADHLRWAQYYVDTEGWVICRENARGRPGAWSGRGRLPLLLGLDPREVRPGCALESREVAAGLRLIAAFGASGMAGRATIQSVDVSQAGCLFLSTLEGTQVRFGLENLERQLRDWRAIHDYAQRQGSNILTLDLSITNYRAVVFWGAEGGNDARPALQSFVENNRHV